MKTCFLLSTLLLVVTAAQAGVRIVPGSRNASQLRPTIVDLNVDVNPAAGLARVISTSVFDNTSPEDFEAEFTAQAPAHSIITQFSYWYRGQKTLARVVEKQRAANIYWEATGAYRPPPQRRDPALVEMLQRNVFRVRVAPVDAKKPLKIEIVWWQPLEKKGKEWCLPLSWRDEASAFGIDRLSLKVRFSNPVQNLDSPFVEAKTTPRTLEYTQQGVQAPEDSVVSFESSQKPLVLQSRSGGEGYFVTMIPAAQWDQWEIWPGVSALHAHVMGDGRYLVAGRFTKNLPAKKLGYEVKTDGEASEKWWASLELDQRGFQDKFEERENTIQISTRYNLPSRWTSWLAIPDSERAKLADIIDRQKITQAYYDRQNLGWALARWKMAGKTNTPQFRAMRASFEVADKLAKRSTSLPVHDSLEDFYRRAAENQVRDMYRGIGIAAARRARQNISNVLQGIKSSDELKKEMTFRFAIIAQVNLNNQQRKSLTERASKSIEAGKPSAKFVAPIRRLAEPSYDGEFDAELQRLAMKVVKSRGKQPRVSQQLENVLKLWLPQKTPDTYGYKNYLQNAEAALFGAQNSRLRQELAQEIIAKRENGPRYAQLRRELDDKIRQSGLRFETGEPDLGSALREAYKKLHRLEHAATLDATAIANAQAELQRLKQYVGAPTFYHFAQEEEYGYDRWRRYLGGQWVIAVKQSGPDSPDAVRLKTELENSLKAESQTYRDNADNLAKGLVSIVRDGEYDLLWNSTMPLYEQLADERSKPELNEDKIAGIVKQLEAIEKDSLYNKSLLTQWMTERRYEVYNNVLRKLDEELNKPTPNETAVAGLTTRLAEVASYDQVFQSFWSDNGWHEKRGTPQEYANLRVKRLEVRANGQRAVTKLKANPPASERQALRREIAEWKLVENQLRVRMGDPLIAIAAPQNARQVLAIFPSGEIRKLEWNDAHKRWEARFDVPTWANEGDYVVQLVVVFANGKRQKLTMHFAVDVHAPTGIAQLQKNGEKWNLSLETDEQTDRVTAFLPWNERAALQRDEEGVFAAQVFVPQEFRGQQSEVRFVLTDKAHNRTEIVMDWQ